MHVLGIHIYILNICHCILFLWSKLELWKIIVKLLAVLDFMSLHF